MPTFDDEISTATAQFKQAIAENDLKLLKKVLSKFSLLRTRSISKEILDNPSNAEALENMHQIFEAIAQVKSPEMIYEILAAGFSAFDLGALFKSKKATKAFIMLTNMLPRLTATEGDEIESSDLTDLPVCTYTRAVALIPVQLQKINYDLLSLFNALIQKHNNSLGLTTWLGFDNSAFKHDELELDLNFLETALHKLYPNGTTKSRCIRNITHDVDDINNAISDRLNLIRFNSYCFTAYLVAVIAILFFGEMQIYKYLATLEEAEANRLWNTYYKLVKLSSLMLQGSLLPGSLYLAMMKEEFDELRATPQLKLEPNELDFDYDGAQKNLIKDISKRFAVELTSEQKPASLLLWRQIKPEKQGSSPKDKPLSNATQSNRSLLKF